MIDRLIENGCRQIILNMAEVRYVDSAGMGLILTAARFMRSHDGQLSLVNVSDQVLALFKRARLVDFIPITAASSDDEYDQTDLTATPLWRTVVPINQHDLSATRAALERLFAQSPLSQSESIDAMLAAGEAMGNAVDHTAGDGATATITSYSDRVIIEVSDNGPGFDPASVKQADTLSERGRGIQLMNLTADSVSISNKPSGHGTLVRIVKLAHTAQGRQ